MSNIAVIGGINHDIVIRVPRIPENGETIHRGQIAHYSGGKGSNQAVAAARAGSVVSMIGAVGADNPGRDLLASLNSHGINTHHVVQTEASTTGTALITVDSKGLNTIAVAEGPIIASSPPAFNQRSPKSLPKPYSASAKCRTRQSKQA